MREILDFLVGKKTYIMIVVDALDQLGIAQGWWGEARMREILEGVLTGFAARAAINTSSPKPIPFISTGKTTP